MFATIGIKRTVWKAEQIREMKFNKTQKWLHQEKGKGERKSPDTYFKTFVVYDWPFSRMKEKKR